MKPERDVAKALIRDLPKECVVYHSYCWLRPDRDFHMNSLLKVEANFLILDLRYGFHVLQVLDSIFRVTKGEMTLDAMEHNAKFFI